LAYLTTMEASIYDASLIRPWSAVPSMNAYLTLIA